MPLCQARLEMKFYGTSPDGNRNRKKFRCPIITGSKREKATLPKQCPVNHELFCSGKCYGCTTYIDVTDDPEAKSPANQNALKTCINAALKRNGISPASDRPREIEEMSQYKYRTIRNQMTLAHLSLSLTTLSPALILE